MSDGIALMSVGGAPPGDAVGSSTRLSVRELLKLYTEIRQLPNDMQEASLVYKCKSDDARALLSYALSMGDAAADALFRRLDVLDSRVAAAAAVETSEDDETALARAAALLPADEALSLIDAFNAAPAQLHSSILAFFEPHRAAAILALCLAPQAAVAPVLPAVLPLLLVSPADKAAAAVREVLEDAASVEPILAAFQQLSLSSRAAVACELPPAAMGLAIVAGHAGVPAGAIGAVWRVLAALSEGMCPSAADLAEVHPTLQGLPALAQGRLARAVGDAGPILEAGAHLEAEEWVRLCTSMRHGSGRITVHAARLSAALVRHEAGALGRSIVTHPEQRNTFGYVCGLFLAVVSFFSLVGEVLRVFSSEARSSALLHLLLDAFILFAALLTCALELEISCTVIRDHIALPLQRSLAFLRLASGRGVFYAAAGLLAIDVSARAPLPAASAGSAGGAAAAPDAGTLDAGASSSAGTLSMLAVSGAMMLFFGAVNLVLGSVVAVKLKRLRRALSGPDALSRAYHAAITSGGPVAAAEGALRHQRAAEGLNAKGAEKLFASLGVAVGRYPMQAVFMEIDGPRKGYLSERSLLIWYHGHIGRHLKRVAGTPPRRVRPVGEWLLRRGRGALYDTSVWATAACLLLLPTAFGALIDSLAQHSLVQLIINLYVGVLAALMLVVELKAPQTKRIALHLQRYAAALLHPTPRGTLYLVLALALLMQNPRFLWVVGFFVEAVGVYHIVIGTRLASNLHRLRRKLGRSRRQVVASYRSVMPDGAPMSAYGLKLLCQSAGMSHAMRWEADRVALLGLLDLDRDGLVTESDLLYWLSPDEEEEEEEEGGGDEGGAADEGQPPASGTRERDGAGGGAGEAQATTGGSGGGATSAAAATPRAGDVEMARAPDEEIVD